MFFELRFGFSIQVLGNVLVILWYSLGLVGLLMIVFL